MFMRYCRFCYFYMLLSCSFQHKVFLSTLLKFTDTQNLNIYIQDINVFKVKCVYRLKTKYFILINSNSIFNCTIYVLHVIFQFGNEYRMQNLCIYSNQNSVLWSPTFWKVVAHKLQAKKFDLYIIFYFWW